MKYKVLITGSNGLIGSRLIRNSLNINYISINVNKKSIDWPVIDDHYHVILLHLAWKSVPGMPNKECLDSSTIDKEMTKNTFSSFVKKYNSCSIVFISTAGDIYKRSSPSLVTESSILTPSSYYSEAKLEIENILSAMHINTVCLRISNAWGAKITLARRNGFIDKAILNSRYLDNPTMVSSSLSSTLSIIHVDDICKALYLLCSLLAKHATTENSTISRYNKIFILSTEFVTVKQVIDYLKHAINAKFIYNEHLDDACHVMADAQSICHELTWTPSILFNSKGIKQAFGQYDKTERK